MLTSLFLGCIWHTSFEMCILHGISGPLATSTSFIFLKIHVVTFILPADLDMNFQIFFKHLLLPPSGCWPWPGHGRVLGAPPSPLPGQLWEGSLPSPDCPTLALFSTSRSLTLIITEEKWVSMHIVLELGLSPKSPYPPWRAFACSCGVVVHEWYPESRCPHAHCQEFLTPRWFVIIEGGKINYKISI